MTQPVTIRVDDQCSFLVETMEGADPAAVRAYDDLPAGASRTSKLDPLRAAEETFTAIGTYLRRTALAATRPDELVIEFGVALKGSAGLPVLVSAGAESTFKITATWKGIERTKEATERLVDGPDRA